MTETKEEIKRKETNVTHSDEEFNLDEIDDFLDAFQISKSKRCKQEIKSKTESKSSESDRTHLNQQQPKKLIISKKDQNMEDNDFEDMQMKSSKMAQQNMDDSEKESNTEFKIVQLRY